MIRKKDVRTHIYLFILVSELIYAFSFYFVNLELSLKC